MIYSALRARSLGIPMKTIRRVLKISPLLFSQEAPSQSRWIGYRTYFLSIEKEVRQMNQPKYRYSGWRRHQNDQGSFGPHKEDPFPLEPVIGDDNISLFLQFVKEINSGKSEIYYNELRIKV
jgi:hypothetical protein